MTDNTNTQPTASKTPSHIVYHVRDTQDGKGFWTRIGALWPHGDGKGFNQDFDLIPLHGRIVIRVPSEKSE